VRSELGYPQINDVNECADAAHGLEGYKKRTEGVPFLEMS